MIACGFAIRSAQKRNPRGATRGLRDSQSVKIALERQHCVDAEHRLVEHVAATAVHFFFGA
jgi:hypothetical protein